MSWTLIEHQALTSSAASVTLGSGGTIPQTYKTLKLVISVRSSFANVLDNIDLRLNGATANRTYRRLYGNGASAFSDATTESYAGFSTGSTATANTFASIELTIPNYASTTTNKASSSDSVSENNATTAYQGLIANLWSSTAAVTSITVQSLNSGNLVSGSTFTLYGLA